jgi:hypothetical protein
MRIHHPSLLAKTPISSSRLVDLRLIYPSQFRNLNLNLNLNSQLPTKELLFGVDLSAVMLQK